MVSSGVMEFGLTIALMVIFAAIMILYTSRQAHALDRLYDVVEHMHMVNLKDRREAKRREIEVVDPLIWVSEQVGIDVTHVIRTIHNPMVVDLGTAGDERVVISPLPNRRLKAALKPLYKNSKRASNMVEPVLGRFLWPWAVIVIERNLTNAGEWFDVEAGLVGQALGVRWGEVERLHFYVVGN